MVKGNKREEKEFKKELFVGFTTVRVVAVNPSKEEVNKLLGKESKEDDKDPIYVSQDADGNKKLRLSFWLHDEKRDKYFVHSINLTDKERQSKNKDKVQLINSTCWTAWVPYIDGTDKPDAASLPSWFTTFTTKEKEVVGTKSWRKALAGEEELGNLLKSWLGRLNFNDPETEVLVDTKKLFNENYKEIRGLIDGDYDTPFTILVGVRTDGADSTKKYQQVWKSFLPQGFMKYIEKGNSFPSAATQKMWERFSNDISGEYGFTSYHEMVPLTEYDESRDVAAAEATKVPAPDSADY